MNCRSSMVMNSFGLSMNRGLLIDYGRCRYVNTFCFNRCSLNTLVQSELPDPEGKPLGFILYADQTKLSSFGSQKGYPIVARCANLPSEIRNGKGLGGGRVVGLLPIVSCIIHFCIMFWLTPLRSKMTWKIKRRLRLSTSNVRSGMSLSVYCLRQLRYIPTRDLNFVVEMVSYDSSFPLCSYCPLTTKSSKFPL